MITLNYITSVEWKDIHDILGNHLSYIGWDNKMKYLWVEKAWNCVGNAKLTSYSNDVERHIVYIRLYAVVDLYCKFISNAMETEYSLDGDEWVSQYNLNPFRLGQLVGQEFEPQEEEDNLLLINAMDELSYRYKDEVLSVLIEGSGGLSCLFTSLWLTHENSVIEDYYTRDENNTINTITLVEKLDLKEFDELIDLNMGMILNGNLNSNKLRVYEWLQEYISE